MKAFNYYQPTEIRFGRGRLAEVGQVVAKYGNPGGRCLLVTVPTDSAPIFEALFGRVKQYLSDAGVTFEHFDGVVPNPTTACISAGAEVAEAFGADVILGVGGGSSMDTAKAIAVEVTHPGTAWDYRWCSETQPTADTLPVIAVTTTSGTGSQFTQVAVLTSPAEHDKSAIFNNNVYAKVGIVDPELMVTVPPHVTASTGFDVFAHSFESYLHPNGSPYTDMMALEAIKIVIENLPKVVKDGTNLDAREAMTWADCLAGLCIANAGVTLPHGIGMTIGGYEPHVMHGEALAITYPEFTRFTYPHAIEKFATLGRIFDPSLGRVPDKKAAKKACEALDAFMQDIGMWLSFESLNVPEENLSIIADHSLDLPDYKNNPRIATRDEVYTILKNSYQRNSTT